ncbi:6-aminohexanoate-dimer hydrolase [Mesorhizobium sp. 113-3-9]|uniref:serine hydrolase domain-containing protein n=1 Tax=Mesorhizobium sp. 113-3-9 TaxID=2744517 RepID=UPI0019255D7C|nr:serine hydrolase [Mesorhizobium sp. 113-3-9]BCG90121.1 6-aminohexanoate-dimer hydrolase [Mesorhizobium sp. 113-3-9]
MRDPESGRVPRPEDLTLANWDRAPRNRWAYQHVSDFLPTAPIAGAEPMPLIAAHTGLDLTALTFADHSGDRVNAAAVLDGSWTDGFLILHRGRVVVEDYRNGMRPGSVHLTQSVSKSVVAALAGILHHRGSLPLDRTVAAYVPEFSDCAYRDVTISQLLDMTSGVHFPEDMADPVSGIGLMDIAVGWKPAPAGNTSPRTVRKLVGSLRGLSRPHGQEFEYRSMETEVLGLCIEAAVRGRLADLVSELIWRPMGAEDEANFAVDPEGYAVADGGLSASLRDLGRFGLIYAQDGCANGRQIVPEQWVAHTRIGDTSLFPERYRADRPNGAYRNQFWIADVDAPVILALGVYGQMIYIDHQRDFVGVKLSTWPEAINPDMRIDMQNLMGTIAANLSSI